MSEKFTQLDIDRINARRSKPTVGEPVGEGVEDESDLHAEILQECRRRGWLALHGSMAHKAKRTAGEWDFTIFTDQLQHVGGVLLVEAKTRVGKLLPAQLALHTHAHKLGHKVHIVRSFAQFLALL